MCCVNAWHVRVCFACHLTAFDFIFASSTEYFDIIPTLNIYIYIYIYTINQETLPMKCHNLPRERRGRRRARCQKNRPLPIFRSALPEVLLQWCRANDLPGAEGDWGDVITAIKMAGVLLVVNSFPPTCAWNAYDFCSKRWGCVVTICFTTRNCGKPSLPHFCICSA